MSGRKNMIANRYEVISHIGQGGMADVFLAIDTILNRQVAVKILRADLSTDAVSILRFEREAQAAAALAHPNIVEIYDVGDYKGHHYIVMEYVPGKTLKQIIRSRGPLLSEEAVDIMKQLCSAVAEAHSRGIIHRDIKPQNVIVKADGSVKILDFGIATAKGSMQLTQANNVMGSVHYLAPELARGEKASPQSDIYALGIVLYEMLAGDVPFKADQAVQIALKHMREPMPSVRAANPSVPQSIENIITRATAKDPRQRYRSCDEMLRDISTCLRPERMNERKLVLQDPLPPRKQDVSSTPQRTVPRQTEENTDTETTYHTSTRALKKAKEKHHVKIMIIVLIVLAIAVTAGFLLYSSYPKTETVPDLTGMTIQEAQTACEEENLNLDTDNITYELTEDKEKGTVISSRPAKGTSVDQNDTVKITVSSGIGVKTEDFTGKNINDVEQQIASDSRYQYVKVETEEADSDEAAGTIISQSGLKAGELFDPDVANTLTLTYSAYPTITIPEDIIGKDLNSAVAELEGMGVVVRTSNRDTTQMTQEELDQIQVGVVVETDPAAGTSYTQESDSYVTLYYY